MAIDIIAGKIICIFCVLAVNLLFGLIPCSLHGPLTKLAGSSHAHRRNFALFVSHLNCFTAGVLMSSALLHLFPDCQLLLDGIISEDLSRKKFPLAEMLTVFGIFFLLIINRSIHCVQKSRCRRPMEQSASKDSVSSKAGIPTPVFYSLRRHHLDPEDEMDMSDIIAENHLNGAPPKILSARRVSETAVKFPDPSLPIEHAEFQSLYVNSGSRKSPSLAVCFVVALSFPGIFSNVALGLQRRNIDMWTLFIGIILRETVHSFTLGLELDRHTDKRYQSLFGVVGFAVLSALGVVIGTGFEACAMNYPSTLTIVAVLQCLANGGIIYIVFFDILFNEMKDDYGFPKVVSTLIGFGVLTFIIGILH